MQDSRRGLQVLCQLDEGELLLVDAIFLLIQSFAVCKLWLATLVDFFACILHLHLQMNQCRITSPCLPVARAYDLSLPNMRFYQKTDNPYLLPKIPVFYISSPVHWRKKGEACFRIASNIFHTVYTQVIKFHKLLQIELLNRNI